MTLRSRIGAVLFALAVPAAPRAESLPAVDSSTPPADAPAPQAGTSTVGPDTDAQRIDANRDAATDVRAVPSRASTAPSELPFFAVTFANSAGGFSVGGSGRVSGLASQRFMLDSGGADLSPNPVETRIRLAPRAWYRRWSLNAEADLASGAVAGTPPTDLRLAPSPRLPIPAMQAALLRQAYLEVKGDLWVARVGQQASMWGIGLVANPGANDASPGDFGQSRFGDLAWRALVAGRPLFSMGGAWRAFEPAVAVDLVTRDDTALLYEDDKTGLGGDRAVQGVLALRFKVDDDRHVGLYGVYRHQRAAGRPDTERSTDAWVLDLAGRWQWTTPKGAVFKLGAEAAWITGWSTMARNELYPRQDLAQLGAALKSSYRRGAVEGLLDVGYASGDQNPYDGKLQAFRFDPDYRVGLLMFDVLGWQSARAAGRASDPLLVGVAPDGVDLLPTRGAVTGATYASPRLRWAAYEWLDLYGGPLLGWTTARLTDAFETRIAGGEPRNSLGGRAGSYLGTEVDLGVQARWALRGASVTLAGELGVLFPGSAFNDASGSPMDSVAAGQLRLAVAF